MPRLPLKHVGAAQSDIELTRYTPGCQAQMRNPLEIFAAGDDLPEVSQQRTQTDSHSSPAASSFSSVTPMSQSVSLLAVSVNTCLQSPASLNRIVNSRHRADNCS